MLAACAPTPSEPSVLTGGLEADAPVRFTVSGHVGRGTCAEWEARIRAQAAGSIDVGAATCTDDEATVEVTALLPGGAAPDVVKTRIVAGVPDVLGLGAMDDWLEACHLLLDEAPATYGERFLAAACMRPYRSHDYEGRYAAPARVWLRPQSMAPRGPVSIDLRSFVVAMEEDANRHAFERWREACADWHIFQDDLSMGRVTSHDCGSPVDLAPGTYYDLHRRLGSLVVDRIALQVPAGRVPRRSRTQLVVGETSVGWGWAYMNWQTACKDAIEAQFHALGSEVFAAAACDWPYAADPEATEHQFLSALTLWTLSEEALEFESAPLHAETLVVGPKGNRWMADDGWLAACGEVPRLVEALTEADVVSYDCGEPVDLAETDWPLFLDHRNVSVAAIELKADVPSGRGVESSTPETVTGEPQTNRGDAAASWRQHCRTRLASLKLAAGTDYLAAICEPPTLIAADGGYTYTSAIRVWSLAPLAP